MNMASGKPVQGLEGIEIFSRNFKVSFKREFSRIIFKVGFLSGWFSRVGFIRVGFFQGWIFFRVGFF